MPSKKIPTFFALLKGDNTRQNSTLANLYPWNLSNTVGENSIGAPKIKIFLNYQISHLSYIAIKI